jgi:hypothetical protein
MAVPSRRCGPIPARPAWALVAVLGLLLQAGMPLVGPPTAAARVHGLGIPVLPATNDTTGAVSASAHHNDHPQAGPSAPPSAPSHDGEDHPVCPICLALRLHGSYVAPGAIMVLVPTIVVASRIGPSLRPLPALVRWEPPRARSPPARA